MTTNEIQNRRYDTTQKLNATPEFAPSSMLYSLTGIGRSQAYELEAEGKIKSVCLRRPGATRGKRLWHIPSILEFLRSHLNADGQTANMQ